MEGCDEPSAPNVEWRTFLAKSILPKNILQLNLHGMEMNMKNPK